jgi:ferrous iron transport protein B
VKTVAVIGNPNVGKTVIFNSLTGMRQHVANWPGVTVEKKEGFLKHLGKRIKVVDLPGTYALAADSLDEKISRDFILNQKPDLVVDILDASNLARNLNLTLQLIEMETPLLLVLNKKDMACCKGMEIRSGRLSEMLGVQVVETVATKGEGIEELKDMIAELVENPQKPKKIRYGELEKEIKKRKERWEAIHEMEDESSIMQARYKKIKEIISETFRKEHEVSTTTDKLDKLFLNKFLALPIFLLLMWGLFHFSYTLSAPFSNLIEQGVSLVGELAGASISSPWIRSLVVEGIVGGMGFILIFIPPIAFLFLALSWLEDSGYLPRAAFFMDRFLSKMGLHGRAFIPMLMGMGCNVPAIMATRSLKNEKDRMVTILVNPLISCSARLPLYVLLAGAFFPKSVGSIIFSLYSLGFVLAISVAWILRKTLFKGKAEPFMLELPDYQLPRLGDVVLKTWQNVAEFLKKASTFLLAGVLIIWFLNSHPWGAGLENSYLVTAGKALEPVFRPLGFGWKENVALVSGFAAKELVVGTLGTIHSVSTENLGGALASSMDALTAYALMVFVLIYTPCLAVLWAIKKETGSWKWVLFSVVYSTLLAYLMAFSVKLIGSFLI